MATVITALDVDKRVNPYVIVKDMEKYFQEILSYVFSTRDPNDLVGPPGSGKTHIGKEVAMQYARLKGCKAYWTQVDEETMRSTLFAGHRFDSGSLVPFKAVVGQAMEEGSIVFVDEFTHGMPSV